MDLYSKSIYSCILNFIFFSTIQIEMKFGEPFFGLVYADFDRNSACQTLGKGDLNVRLELPLKGCGTIQVTLLILFALIESSSKVLNSNKIGFYL